MHDLRSRPPVSAGPAQRPQPRARTTGPVAADIGTRALSAVGLLISLLLAGLATLTPVGTGWRWGAPATELRWYLTGLDHPATLFQLVANLDLLAVPAACAVRLWPAVGRVSVLAPVGLAAGTAVEALQWLLSIGRVVSPLDALLNATGAVLAGWGVAVGHRWVRRWSAPAPGLPPSA
jgi:hypothetical protein